MANGDKIERRIEWMELETALAALNAADSAIAEVQVALQRLGLRSYAEAIRSVGGNMLIGAKREVYAKVETFTGNGSQTREVASSNEVALPGKRQIAVDTTMDA